ncbi:transporter [Arthrobacter sp. ISL-30]|uniref:transporter n=1 Tax=Arthrobacter sp. ISL-30 TaxID=2819109 RepID=UPI001BE76BC7|nr:transporter [Arthrobacter sp. ISL-30]MBT2513978.1 transporter [Arthrobacter sp. ISL-30]
MVAHLLSLKFRLLLNGFRRSPGQVIGMVIGGLYALGLAAVLVAILVALRWADPGAAHAVVVLGGAGAMLGWLVIPLLASAADMTLDPARFTTAAIPMPQLLAGLTLAGFIGVPGLATAVISLATTATWWRSVPSVFGALIGAVLGATTCVVLSKVATTATASLASSRRFKDVSSIVFLIPLMLLGPLIATATQGLTGSGAFLPRLAHTLAWTPLGAAWSLGGELYAGDFGGGVLKLLVALATLVGLLWLWKLLLQHALVTPPYAGTARKGSGKLGLFRVLPATPTGAITARALIYWLKDPRYAASLVVLPLLPVILFFSGRQGGSFEALSLLGPMTAFLLSWAISADVSYDSTAFALHLATGVKGVHDRLGRSLACLAFGFPVVVVFTVLPMLVTGQWELLPNQLGLSLGVLFTGLGLSSVVSARYTVVVPLPGDSPFKKPPGNVAQTLAVQFGGMFVLALLVTPEVALMVAQIITGSQVAGWANLFFGPALGLVLFAGGVRLGGEWLDARGPELFARLTVNR